MYILPPRVKVHHGKTYRALKGGIAAQRAPAFLMSARAAAGGAAISCAGAGITLTAPFPLSRGIAAGDPRPRHDMGVSAHAGGWRRRTLPRFAMPSASKSEGRFVKICDTDQKTLRC